MEEQILGQIFGDHANRDGERDSKKASISGIDAFLKIFLIIAFKEYSDWPVTNCAFRYGDHYEWNKVVTCIHNVLSQQRYLEHYGEVIIQNLNSSVCTCKITFVKVSKGCFFIRIKCIYTSNLLKPF